MDIQEQIRAFQQKRNEATERQTQIMKAAGDEGRTLDENEASEYDGITAEVGHIEKHLERLRALSVDGSNADPVKSKAPTIIVKKTDPDDKFHGQGFTRLAIAKALSVMSGGEYSPGQIAEMRWGKSHPNLVRWIKAPADVAGGVSSDAAFAGRLVTPDNRYTGDFIEYLAGMTIYDRLPLREVPANITIKGQDGIATANWVGEAAAIPPSAQSFTTISLTPLKVAAISVLSNEIIRDSSPSAEMLVRDGLAQAIGQKIDQTFLGTANETSGVLPAGILYNLSAGSSNGTTADDVRADIMDLYAQFLTAKNASGLYVVTTTTLAKTISLMVNAMGVREFPEMNAMGGTLLGDPCVAGDNVGSGDLILLKPSDIWKIGDLGIDVSISRDATLEMNTEPAMEGAGPTTPTGKLVNMFQTEMTAFKVVRPINFKLRRSTAVAYIGDAAYALVESIADPG